MGKKSTKIQEERLATEITQRKLSYAHFRIIVFSGLHRH